MCEPSKEKDFVEKTHDTISFCRRTLFFSNSLLYSSLEDGPAAVLLVLSKTCKGDFEVYIPIKRCYCAPIMSA